MGIMNCLDLPPMMPLNEEMENWQRVIIDMGVVGRVVEVSVTPDGFAEIEIEQRGVSRKLKSKEPINADYPIKFIN